MGSRGSDDDDDEEGESSSEEPLPEKVFQRRNRGEPRRRLLSASRVSQHRQDA